jgi:hypothetical protein
MANSRAERIRELEREIYLQRSGSASREMDVPLVLLSCDPMKGSR